jgi:hypothetical protein
MDTAARHPLHCRCGATLGHDAGCVLILAPGVVVVTRVQLQCVACGARRWWHPAPPPRERAIEERWQRGRAVELIEV